MPPLFNYNRTPRAEKLLNHLDDYFQLIAVTQDFYPWSDRYRSQTVLLKDLLALIQPGDIMVYARVLSGSPGHLAIRTDYGKIEALYPQGVTETSLGNELKLLAGYGIKVMSYEL